MSQDRKQHFKKMLKRVGRWAGVRYMRNQGVAFEDAYEIVFERKPRLV